MHAEVAHHVLGVGEHVHEMRDRRALIAGDVRDAGLKQGFGDRENAFAAKDLAGLKSQVLNFALEGPFRHRLAPFRYIICMSIFSGSCGVNDKAVLTEKARASHENAHAHINSASYNCASTALPRQFHFASVAINGRLKVARKMRSRGT